MKNKMPISSKDNNCKRCGIEFENNNEAVECPECYCLTLCEMCAMDNSCCKNKESNILREWINSKDVSN